MATDYGGVPRGFRLVRPLRKPGLCDGSADVRVIDDPQYAGWTPGQLAASDLPDPGTGVIYAADERTLTDPEHPILVIDRTADPAMSFRNVPSQLAIIDGNLFSGNLLFEEFAEGLGEGEIYRGH